MIDIKNLETQYLKAKVAYYDGTPIMSDAAFDVLEKEIRNLGSKVIEQIGSKRKDFDFPHPNRMLSLSKIQTEVINNITNYQEDLFNAWFEKRNAIIVAKTGSRCEFLWYSPKFDGNAINIIIRGGKLQSVLTRGSGDAGKDVTDRFINYIPNIYTFEHISITDTTIIEIRCEAVIPIKIFNSKYANDFANARNYVAGVIGKDDFNVEKVSELVLMPVAMLVDGKQTSLENLNFKDDNIISKVTHQHTTKLQDYISCVKLLESLRDNFEYQLDGIVFSFPYEHRDLLGVNSHDPEYSIAIKFPPEEAVTMVTGIEWSVSKTGELIPVILLKPVQLAGTTVKRVSGYNAGYIVNNKIKEGTVLSLHKSGDIIPEVSKVF